MPRKPVKKIRNSSKPQVNTQGYSQNEQYYQQDAQYYEENAQSYYEDDHARQDGQDYQGAQNYYQDDHARQGGQVYPSAQNYDPLAPAVQAQESDSGPGSPGSGDYDASISGHGHSSGRESSRSASDSGSPQRRYVQSSLPVQTPYEHHYAGGLGAASEAHMPLYSPATEQLDSRAVVSDPEHSYNVPHDSYNRGLDAFSDGDMGRYQSGAEQHFPARTAVSDRDVQYFNAGSYAQGASDGYASQYEGDTSDHQRDQARLTARQAQKERDGTARPSVASVRYAARASSTVHTTPAFNKESIRAGGLDPYYGGSELGAAGSLAAANPDDEAQQARAAGFKRDSKNRVYHAKGTSAPVLYVENNTDAGRGSTQFEPYHTRSEHEQYFDPDSAHGGYTSDSVEGQVRSAYHTNIATPRDSMLERSRLFEPQLPKEVRAGNPLPRGVERGIKTYLPEESQNRPPEKFQGDLQHAFANVTLSPSESALHTSSSDSRWQQGPAGQMENSSPSSSDKPRHRSGVVRNAVPGESSRPPRRSGHQSKSTYHSSSDNHDDRRRRDRERDRRDQDPPESSYSKKMGHGR